MRCRRACGDRRTGARAGAAAIAAVAAALLTLAPGFAAATTPKDDAAVDPVSALCLDAARAAAVRYGIPVRMMRAITLVETGRTKKGAAAPWPWTLNVDGKGYWHDSRAAALDHAEREIAAGGRSVDIGCFQLNYRWHGANFASPDAMLDPDTAADYAARFLAGLHAETGDWMRAAGLYHSRTPTHAHHYQGLIGRVLARLDPDDGGAHTAFAAPRPAPKPGPRRPEPEPGPGRPAPDWPGGAGTILLAAAGPLIDRKPVLAPGSSARDRTAGVAPGAVRLRLFARTARPLIAADAPAGTARP